MTNSIGMFAAFAADIGLFYLSQWLYQTVHSDLWARFTAVLAVLLPQLAVHLFGAIVPLNLGLFSIQTYRNFGDLPAGFQLTLDYILTPAGGTDPIDSGTVTLTLGAVPEPASLALLGLGLALPVAAAARRRRRAAA